MVRINPPAGRFTAQGLAYGIVESSKYLNAKCILVISKSGRTAENIARYRPYVPIVAFVPDAKLGRQLQLNRGIHPFIAPSDLTSTSSLTPHERFDVAVEHARRAGFCSSGDEVIIVAGDQASHAVSAGTTMRVIKVL
jgi:pyruvate kinase